MMVHNNHEHVDRDGLVFAPYLAHWEPKSNLKELTKSLCIIFSEMPPLFSR